MESTATNRVWHKGPPPHVGWWNASRAHAHPAWRWWNGELWSSVAYHDTPTHKLERLAGTHTSNQHLVEWTDYWPEDARVPRIDPAVGYLDIGDARWYLFNGAPVKGRISHNDNSWPWKRWAEQRNKITDPLGLIMRAEPPLPREFQGIDRLYTPAKIGRTRMVDGNELTKLAGQARQPEPQRQAPAPAASNFADFDEPPF